MSAYRLTLRAPLAARADLSGINPATLAGLSAQAVGWLTLPYGNGAVQLGDLFEVSEVEGGALIIGGDPRLDFVGAQMAEGAIEVDGPVGVLAGSGMIGGSLLIRGDAGDGLAAGLEGGRVEVTGSAGAGVGGALTGDRQGMTAGTVSVAGSVGPSLGARMRGGLILVGGDAGPRAADGLIAGTLAVAGRLAAGAGRGMKRGTILAATAPEAPAPGFVSTGPHDLVMLALLARRVPELAGLFGGLTGRAERLVGNRLAGGTGEILVLQ
ncbi:UNVERIFIED_ORG: formylmethanofuran dehydrogenase subunit C [Xanthobacter viscosus]|uniref:Formylmethanofuran dehydrogenase subunit C n=1 Tax=Xanthobacter autotrophicus TaxID=280 RepID=A0A6C1KSU3_XANAU|nr:formylmethanofuran dehydrogenase subunit C [Xanthobacter autotrophicus]TLX41843.1 formylmethanofuran dehydrogenase subunit C [Xanthobacter autotrophicus]